MSEVTLAQRLFDLTGEVALVTGASSGLGARFARVLAAHGAKVIAAARRVERLEALAGEHPNIAPLAMDVSQPAAFEAALAAAAKPFGPLTLLVNNAGIAGDGRAADATLEDWRSVQRVNVEAVWELSRLFAREMMARNAKGSIINIASLASYKVSETSASYAISKAAVLQMTKAHAFEWARHGIRVNAICPGYVHSEMTDDYLASPEGEKMLKRVPQRRAGDPSDLDGTLLLLASPRASGFMTGSAILVDGGHSLT